MIELTIYRVCDSIICSNIDLLSIMLGFGIGTMLMYFTRKRWNKTAQEMKA